MNQRQRNALTKARIKIRRAKTPREAVEAVVGGIIGAIFHGIFEFVTVEGEGWTAKGIIVHA